MNSTAIRTGLMVIAAVSAATASAFLFLSSESGSTSLLKSGDAAVTARGQQIYAENCAACHGANLQGQPNWRSPDDDGLLPAPPHDETGHTWHHTEKLLFELTKNGLAATAGLKDHKTRMPVYDGVLSDDDIIAVLSFIKSRWPENIQRRHTEMSAQDQ